MEDQIRDFLDILRQRKGYTRNTVEAYRNDLTQLLNFAQNERPALTGWNRVDKPLLLLFIQSLKERGYTPSSVARKIAVIRSFFHFLVESKRVDSDPTATLGSPKVEKHLPRVLSVEELERLFAASARHSTPKGFRDRAILESLYASGARVTELVSLNVEDVDWAARVLYCGEPGAKRRAIPLEARALEALDKYMQRGRPAFATGAHERALFVNPHGERLTRQGLWLIIKESVKEAGITTPVTPHTLRHSFAVHLLNRGMGLEIVQRLLGHTNLATTQMYARLVDAQASAAPEGASGEASLPSGAAHRKGVEEWDISNR